jgi:hypothetical protein
MTELDADRTAARALFERNRLDAARDAYVALLERAPDDPAVLADAGTFFFKTGALAAAQSVFERAVAVDDSLPSAHVNVANVHFVRGDFEAARAAYARALALDPQHALAHQGMSYALVRLDRDEEAAQHRRLGFAGRVVTTAPYRGSAPPVDVLVLVATAGGTIYTDSLLDDTTFRTTTFAADVDGAGDAAVPPHDAIFNALADADRIADALRLADRRFGGARAILNAPARVLETTRERNAERLGELAGVVTPRIASIERAALERSGAAALTLRGFTFPLLLRSPGYQTGRHFVRVETPADVADAVRALPGDTLLAIEFVDVRGDDGTIRKYRMMFVGGVLYPLHAAVAHAWKVHYVTAAMDDPLNRADDDAFLRDPESVIGARAMRALERVRDTLALDYAGIDFSLDRAGNVVAFEANATMIVLPPAADAIWDYRREPVARVIAAVRRLVVSSRAPS